LGEPDKNQTSGSSLFVKLEPEPFETFLQNWNPSFFIKLKNRPTLVFNIVPLWVLVHPKVTQVLKDDGKKEDEWRSEHKTGAC
jgi:hypothetical protein